MKKQTVWVALIFAALLLQSPHPSPADPEAKIRPALGRAMREAAAAAEALHVWVYFKDKGVARGRRCGKRWPRRGRAFGRMLSSAGPKLFLPMRWSTRRIFRFRPPTP